MFSVCKWVPVWLSGLRIHRCHCRGSGSCCGVGVNPWSGNFHMQRKKKEGNFFFLIYPLPILPAFFYVWRRNTDCLLPELSSNLFTASRHTFSTIFPVPAGRESSLSAALLWAVTHLNLPLREARGDGSQATNRSSSHLYSLTSHRPWTITLPSASNP